MTPERLENYLTFVLTVTQADRCLIVDEQQQTLASRHFDSGVLNSEAFAELASQVLKHAMETNRPVITNNIIIDPAEAPTTNTAFSDLRIVVGLPVPGVGALYMDRPVRHGAFDRALLDQLIQFSPNVLNAQEPIDADAMRQRFQASC
jgi:hypothetical protein